MSMQDPIADMFTRIRNAQAVNKKTVEMPFSKVKEGIAKVLESEGYIRGYTVSKAESKSTLVVELKYYKGKPVIEILRRISKPGLRIYKSVLELPKVLGGLGIAIVSTSKGIVADKTARSIGQGGEVIAIVA